MDNYYQLRLKPVCQLCLTGCRAVEARMWDYNPDLYRVTSKLNISSVRLILKPPVGRLIHGLLMEQDKYIEISITINVSQPMVLIASCYLLFVAYCYML